MNTYKGRRNLDATKMFCKHVVIALVASKHGFLAVGAFSAVALIHMLLLNRGVKVYSSSKFLLMKI